METLNSSCFFCRQEVPQQMTYDSGDIEDNNSYIFRETDKKCILQIAHYLQIPRTDIINQGDEISKLSTCPSCWNISGKLGKLCGELEVIQMKIAYFINLLSDKILSNDSSKTEQFGQSSFQETFYKNCLWNSATWKMNPEIRIDKCQVPNQPEVVFENFDDDNVNFDDDNTDIYDDHGNFDEDNDNFDNHNVKLEDNSDSISDICQDSSEPVKLLEVLPHFKCEYCPLTSSSRGNLESHMKAVHANKKSKQNIKTCDICGAMFNIKSFYCHRKSAHGIGKTLPSNLEIRTKKRCEICGKLISAKNMSKHRRFCESNNKGKKDVKRDFGEDAEEVETYLIKKEFKCKKCNACFERKGNLLRHFSQNEACRGYGGNVKEIESEKIIKCPNNCGQSFSLELCLKRHLLRSCKGNRDAEEDSKNKIEIRIICKSEICSDANGDDEKVDEEGSGV